MKFQCFSVKQNMIFFCSFRFSLIAYNFETMNSKRSYAQIPSYQKVGLSRQNKSPYRIILHAQK